MKTQLKPFAFKEATHILGKPKSMTDEECKSLHVHMDGKTVVSCWKLNFIQRLMVLLFGKIWLNVYSGEYTQPPVWLDCANTVFVHKDESNGEE